jgi:hypothetical protein
MRRYGWLLLAGVCLHAAAQSQSPDSAAARLAASSGGPIDKAQLEMRLEAVGKLIESSSAAQQIEASGDGRAREKRDKARAIHKASLDAYRGGDLATSSRLLPEASVLMFEAVRLAAPEQVAAGKTRSDFNARHESVKSLLAAYTRIAAEKRDPRSAETTRVIEASLGEAQRLAEGGRHGEGRAVLDRAYLVAKAAIGSVRQGDTLVRSLNFASKEEEYVYELDRNDTHQMLIKVLLDEKRGSGSIDGMLKGYVDKAQALRGQAQSAAQRKDWTDGIRLLEESTAELVRAIRNAGIYIPG